MPITFLDLILLVVMLISAMLAMIRGFMREILSIAAWVIAAIATVSSYARLLPLATQYFNQAGTVEDPNSRKTLESVLGLRDSVSAQLAKGDPAVIGDLERIMAVTREATR